MGNKNNGMSKNKESKLDLQTVPKSVQRKNRRNELSSLSKILIPSSLGAFADVVGGHLNIAGKHLAKGFVKAKEVGKLAGKKYDVLKVEGLIAAAADRNLFYELNEYMHDEKKRNECISVLVEISKNINAKEFDKFLFFLGQILVNYRMRGDDYGFNVNLLKDLLAASNSVPGHFLFLADQVFKSYATAKILKVPYGDIDYNRNLRSFTLTEMVDLLKKHGKAGEAIIDFVDSHIKDNDFLSRKKMILAHLGKLSAGAADNVFKELMENYRKYPRVTAALYIRGSSFEGVNMMIKSIEPFMVNSTGYEKISGILEWIPVGETVDIEEMFSSQWSIDLIYNNRDFIKSYCETTGVIDFGGGGFVEVFVKRFPIQLLDGSKSQLLELAKKYDKLTLKALLLYKIHGESDLKFLLKNSEKLSAWFKSLRLRDAMFFGDFYSCPSVYLLENHFDDLVKIGEKIAYGDGRGRLPYSEFPALIDDDLIKKYGNIYFLIIKRDDTFTQSAAVESFNKVFIKAEPMLEKNKDKIKELFSRFFTESALDRSSFLLRILNSHPKVLGDGWSGFKTVLSEFLKYKANVSFPGIFPKLCEIDYANLDAKEMEVIKKIIKLYLIGIPGQYSQNELVESLSLDLKKDGENISILIDDFFENNKNAPSGRLKKIMERVGVSEKSGHYKEKLEGLRNLLPSLVNSGISLKNMQICREDIDLFSKDDVAAVTFLQSTYNNDDVVAGYLKEALDAVDPLDGWPVVSQYLLKDHRDGSDLLDFDYGKINIYQKLFESARKAGWTKFEKNLIDGFKLEKFKKAFSSKTIFEIDAAISDIENKIDPRFGEKLFRKILLPKLSEELVVGKTLLSWRGKTANGEFKIDVTQNNLAKVNTILRILSKTSDIVSFEAQGPKAQQILIKNIVANIKVVFPSFESTGKPESDIKWLIEKFDVEEINFKKLDSLAEFTEFQRLLDSMTKNDSKSAARYLENSIKDIDFSKMSFEGSDYSVFDIKQIEKLRGLVNSKSRVVGDMLIDRIGSSFLETNCCDYANIAKLIKFAHVWEKPGINRDIDGLYQVYSTYAFVEIGSFIKEQVEKDKSSKNLEKVKEKLKKHGVDFDTIVKELEDKDYLVLTESNAAKALSAAKQGFVGYAFRKGVSKLVGGESVEVDGKKIELKESDWAKRDGVKVFSLLSGGTELAKLIKCDSSKIKVKVLAEASGMVDMDAESKRLGRKFIFSAPLTFTTGARKMTELAFRDGIQMNYLLSPYSKDGFLVVNERGEQKVLNKTLLKIGDIVGVEDLQNKDIRDLLKKWATANKIDILKHDVGENIDGTKSIFVPQIDESKFADLMAMPINPVKKFIDKNTFFGLIRLKKYSLLGGMLLIDKHEGGNEGTVSKLNDGGESRRFYVQFADGQFGILNSTQSMSSAQMVDLALSVGAIKAIYMDTGMYDMATYQDGSGKSHVMGHRDTSESTNRVVIYEP